MLKVILIFLVLYAEDSMERRVMHYNKFANCNEYPNLPITITYFKQHNYEKNNRTTEKKFHVEKEIKGNLEIIGNLTKCDISGAPDTCEIYIKDFKFTKICQKMNEKGQVWTPFIESFEPPLGCPMQPGDYMNESPVKESHSLRFFPVPTGLWKARGIMRNENELLMCGDFEVKIMEVRRN